jgi:hypothetical protein
MPAKLTQILVERQPFTSTGTRWITDTELKGFSLAIGRTVKAYYAAAEVGGRLLRRKLGHADVLTAPQARNLAKEMLVDLRRGIDPKRATTETLEESLATYLSRRRVKASTARQYAVSLYLKDWLRRDVASLTRQELDAKHRQVGKRAPYAANNVMRVLRAIMRDAVKRGVIADDPTVAVSWFQERRRQTRIGARLNE